MVRWIDLSPHQARLVESPLDIRDALAQQMRSSRKAWIFTSATLGDDERLSWFTESAGLDEATCLRVGSPFDYGEHARLYIPRGFPKPNQPGHGTAVAELAARCALALGGRSFVLTTTLRALRQIGDELKQQFSAMGADIQVLIQGQVPKRQLLARFLSQPRSVLVGSQSFWEGIDVPGEALQCVIIDKLPFPPPNDPLVEARVRRLEERGSRCVRRLLRRRGGGFAQAGRRAVDPQRNRSRPAGGLRSAHGGHELRTADCAPLCLPWA